MILSVDLTKLKEFPNYGITEYGHIYNLNYRKPGILRRVKPYVDKDGYLKIGIYKDKKRYPKFVHRLAAQTFISNPCNKPEVNHDDGVKFNNFKDNLIWSTRSENQKHAYQMGLQKPSEKQKAVLRIQNKATGLKLRKLTQTQIIDIKAEYSQGNISQRALAKKYNIGQSKICLIINNKAYMEVI